MKNSQKSKRMGNDDFLTYQYAVFLRNKVTQECMNMVISVDSDPGQESLTIHSLMMKLAKQTRVFPAGFTLVSMMVIDVQEVTHDPNVKVSDDTRH
ncbi:hypothetical protein Presley_77 [Acinetobacter phage Presley]|uniref:Uncharacterized protein n=1 Tax=Acinetobacter phage Presley TaxID=1406780 RepID=U5PW49_9CAUD|nr:hypothetical protein Presley_77 [Acinetobacter phage Presley]AGY48144.1 hypothetical protein Presley_77 [Acinetobacter phage Presley]